VKGDLLPPCPRCDASVNWALADATGVPDTPDAMPPPPAPEPVGAVTDRPVPTPVPAPTVRPREVVKPEPAAPSATGPGPRGGAFPPGFGPPGPGLGPPVR